jgi:hypothetical protein
MADFYVLPPRPVVGEQIAHVLREYLPGVRVTASDGLRFLEQIADRSRAFVVHREDLPEGDDVATALRDGFGTGPDDRIVPVSVDRRLPTQPSAVPVETARR